MTSGPGTDWRMRSWWSCCLWDEETFLAKTAGSAIRRIGYERWLRNVAVALGNAPRSDAVINALLQRRDYPVATGAGTRGLGAAATRRYASLRKCSR